MTGAAAEEPSRRPAPTRLRPPVGARLMNAVVGLLLWLPALPVIGEQTPAPAWSGPVLVVAGAVLAWRGFHLRVDCDGGAVTVHGYLRNRTIECAGVTHLDEGALPAIAWRTDGGRIRSTELRAFRRNPRWPSHDAHHAANLRRLRRHIRRHRR